jgi:hypothetical protein
VWLSGSGRFFLVDIVQHLRDRRRCGN